MPQIAKLVHAGKYAAEVMVTSIPDDDAWGPYFSLEDAVRIERVTKALKVGDLEYAARDARIFELTPIVLE